MHFNPFVIPFTAGMLILSVLLLIRYIKWISSFGKNDYALIKSNIVSFKTLMAVKEVFLESLLHRKIFKTNKMLGYMHMSLAFGWFLLIFFGKIETFLYTGKFANELYFPVFFRFFEQDPHPTGMLIVFNALMDFFLLVVLSGMSIAIIKRFKPGMTGMKQPTRHSLGDRIALATLWAIFPLRLLAESATAGFAHNGSFLTQPLGNIMSSFLPLNDVSILFWWMYSIALGGFMVSIPFSRYMHIPTEILLIFLRNWGLKCNEQFTGFAEIEIQSCSRCGICIDACQMNFQAANRKSQMVYFLRDYRYNQLTQNQVDHCLLCGRCTEACPVGIDLTQQRILQRRKREINTGSQFMYLPAVRTNEKPVEVIYFAGCMSHLSPNISRSMTRIFEAAGVKYRFLDKEGSICCGRPLKLAGQFEAAENVAKKNKELILSSGAKILVTSCPICYKTFKNDYHLPMRVMHHSEYLPELLVKTKLPLNQSVQSIVYHDPCELGRGSNIYEQPRMLLGQLGTLQRPDFEREKALCCGGSLGNLSLTTTERDSIRKTTAETLNACSPQVVATSCPLCKKSLATYSEAPVRDIAEILAVQLVEDSNHRSQIMCETVGEMGYSSLGKK